MESNVALIIIAAGRGARIQKDLGNALPKVLQPLQGKPLIRHLLDTVAGAPVVWPPVIVIGYQGEMVEQELGPDYTYVWQREQLGTGHAVLQARAVLEGMATDVVVLYGDMPRIGRTVIEQLVNAHRAHNNTLTFASATVPDFLDWRAGFMSYGRVVRNEQGAVARIVENKDASEKEREIREVNIGAACYRAAWLWQHLEKLRNDNAQGEYYLTDILAMALAEGERVETIAVDPRVALGVNTAEELQRLETMEPFS
ncbi:MAG: NTP transferase domain-containing protein [Candidatus Magasanikbacteria bacterium]|nr:NTP transferase domain-containing protein [Candidatus Magasanikbacteria bacterium]